VTLNGTMKAAVVYARGDLRLEDVPRPAVPAGSILVRVMACGLCGTDLRIYRKGDHRAAYPVIVGHEVAGVVEAVSPGVTGVREGDRVCVAPGIGCGRCRMCLQGHLNVCTHPFPPMGYKVNGGFAEYLAVPENVFRLGFVNPIPASLSFDQAALSEIVACCLNGQRNAAVREGDAVLIIGAGPAGIIQAMLARHYGARRILLTQRSRARLEMARSKVLIDRIIASSDEDLDKAVMDETDGEGADVVFVCAPSREAQEAGIRLVAPRGRVNFFGGLPKDDRMITLDANALHYKEFFIGGASSSLPEGNREALRLLSERVIDPDLLITATFPLEAIHAAFDEAESRRGIKIIVRPSSGN